MSTGRRQERGQRFAGSPSGNSAAARKPPGTLGAIGLLLLMGACRVVRLGCIGVWGVSGSPAQLRPGERFHGARSLRTRPNRDERPIGAATRRSPVAKGVDRVHRASAARLSSATRMGIRGSVVGAGAGPVRRGPPCAPMLGTVAGNGWWQARSPPGIGGSHPGPVASSVSGTFRPTVTRSSRGPSRGSRLRRATRARRRRCLRRDAPARARRRGEGAPRLTPTGARWRRTHGHPS